MPVDSNNKLNPYTSPTNLGSGDTAPIEQAKVKRPISVWLMQVFMFMFVGLSLYSTIRTVRDFSDNSAAHIDVWRIIVVFIVQLVFLVGFTSTAIALYRRANWSKWVSLVLLALLVTFTMLRPDTTYYANDAERTGGYIGRYLFFPLLFVWWAYALAFSDKAKRYFSRVPSES